MDDGTPVIYIVEDDTPVRRRLSRLLRAAGYAVRSFGSADDFLKDPWPDAPGCLVLAVRLPGLGGLELQEILSASDRPLPVVFITAYGDIRTSVRAMKAGAVDFLTKPVDPRLLLAAVGEALERDEDGRRSRSERSALEARTAALSPREFEVFARISAGWLNKQVAARMGVTEKTIKVHRAKVMRKMGAVSLAELVRMADRLGIAPDGSGAAPRAYPDPGSTAQDPAGVPPPRLDAPRITDSASRPPRTWFRPA